MNFPRLKRLTLIALALRSTAWLLSQWLWIALVVCIVMPPMGLHILWEYSYSLYGSNRVYRDCHYLGLGGVVRYARTGNCPLIIWIEDEDSP